jgi:hypothetical protein
MDDLTAALGAARAALMQGDKTTARAEVATVLRADPRNAQAWLLMSGIVATPAQQRDCLVRVLAIDPANAAARRGLDALDAAAAPASQPPAFAPPPAPAAGAAQVRPPAARTDDQWRPAQPPAGIRPLATAPRTDDQWRPAPAAPAWNSPQSPSASGSGMVPTAPLTGLGPAPAVPDLAAPGYAPGWSGAPGYTPGYPAPAQRQSQTLKIVTGVLLGLFIILCLVGSALTNKRRNMPPPTPKISAQDRATGFINSILGHYNNPLFFNADTVADLVRPTARQYLRPEGVEEFLRGMEEEMRANPVSSSLVSRLGEIKQTYAANPRYTVIEETPAAITLDVTGGDIWMVMQNGQSVSQPMRDSFRRVYLENIDGVWYIRRIIFR